jgi:hypothetical protein
MTPAGFRRLALSFPGSEERAHMGHPDFRVRGKIFATLGWPDETWGMVNLTPDEQALFIESNPTIFEAVPGAWGRRGSTKVRLKEVDAATLRSALAAAWCNKAPKTLVGSRKRSSNP